MKFIKVLIISFLIFGLKDDDFLKTQKKNKRVKNAFNEKFNYLSTSLNKMGVGINNMNLILIAYKDEQKIDVYVKNSRDSKYIKFKTYDICEKSGVLGPKRKEGDLQVPEGFYYINHFNPASNFYLSLGLNYPNVSDKIKSGNVNPGGAIYIHGDCVTIGCLPLTDDKIKEIYVLACMARSSGQNKIPVYIFPYEMVNSKHEEMKNKFRENQMMLRFWENIKIGYNQFITNMKEVEFSTDSKGNYNFKK
ncbi:MAG: murein L,D-transpeptidase family protein [Bacteroidota bacterium]|jgi:murein L,D-transpeptidase YafK